MADAKLLMMPWFPESFIAATRGWSFTERAIYRELLDVQWIQGSLPNDEKELIRLVGCSRKEWAASWPRVRQKFDLVDGELKNARLEEHRAKAISLRDKRRFGAQKTNAKRYGIDSDSARSATRSATRTSLAQRDAQRSHDTDTEISVLRTDGKPSSIESDPRKEIFDLGVRILGEKHRSLVGKAVAQLGEARVGEILGGMAAKPPVDPVAYFAAATKPKERGVVV